MRKFILDMIYSDPLVGLGLFFSIAFLITFYVVPRVRTIAAYKNLTVLPKGRNSHTAETPNLAGIAFYFTLIICLFFLYHWDDKNINIYLIPGLTILFVVGLKDDLVSISPKTKLLAQIFAVSFVVLHKSLFIYSLNGFLSVSAIPFYVALPLGGIIMVAIINAYNLIDGIDGLASIVGIVIFAIYGVLFFYMDDLYFTSLAVIIIGILTAFLPYNFSASKKIFMGDTGSLVIGFILGVFTLHFLALDTQSVQKLPILLENIPLIIMAVLVIPLFDTTRVFVIRLLNKQNPFKPDRNHIHHILVDSGMSHKKTSCILGFANLLVFLIFLVEARISSNKWVILSFLLIGNVSMYLLFLINKKYSNVKRKIMLRKKIYKVKQHLRLNKISDQGV